MTRRHVQCLTQNDQNLPQKEPKRDLAGRQRCQPIERTIVNDDASKGTRKETKRKDEKANTLAQRQLHTLLAPIHLSYYDHLFVLLLCDWLGHHWNPSCFARSSGCAAVRTQLGLSVWVSLICDQRAETPCAQRTAVWR
eukprot:34939-Prorocentrum_minimum.AAC.3